MLNISKYFEFITIIYNIYIFIYYGVNLYRVSIYNNHDNVSNIVCITLYIKAHSPIYDIT